MKPFTITGWTRDSRTRTVSGPVSTGQVVAWEPRRNAWSEDEDNELIELRRKGVKARFVGRRLNRTTNAVFHRISILRSEGRWPCTKS